MKTFVNSLVAAAALMGLALPAWAADQKITAEPKTAVEQKIATVDLNKVFTRYYKTVQSTAAIRAEADDIEKERAQMVDAEKKHKDEWQALIEKANDQAASAEARDRSTKDAKDKYAELEAEDQALTQFARRAGTRLEEKKRQRTEDIVKEILNVLGADAKAAGYAMVLDSSGASANGTPALLFSNGQNDLTDDLIKELNAAAPAASLDTNSVPAASATNSPPAAK